MSSVSVIHKIRTFQRTIPNFTMKSKVIEFLTFVFVLCLVDFNSACKNRTRQKRDDPDYAGMAASAAGTVIEMMKQGAGAKSDMKVKYGNQNDNQIIKSKLFSIIYRNSLLFGTVSDVYKT